ncbi:Lipase 1 [Colletotrichum sp. SAR 10_77]|nr:Lipase 1 [Colletotrichum sp. SAR 10_77]
MKAILSIAALFAPLAAANVAHGDMPPRSMSTSEFHQAFMESGIVPEVMGSFDPMVSFYAGYMASDGDKALMMPGSKLKMKEVKMPFEFSVENISMAQNVTRNSRFIVLMIGPDSPSRENPSERNIKHYLAGNFTVEQTKSAVLNSSMIMKNSSAAFTEYMPPEPKSGSGMHRYIYLLYVQPEKMNRMGFDMVGMDMKDRKNFNLTSFRKMAGLKRPIGGTFFTLNMAKDGVCIQEPGNSNLVTYIKTDLEYGEDCLNLNVYRPAGVSIEEKLPVLIWIHGGLFRNGAGIIFDGASFVASSPEPVMVVTFNYRLAALGFLASPLLADLDLVNLGLQDQHQLLRFVHKYISSFGGDPDRVTLGGKSAGAHSVGFHYQNPFAEGEKLFHQAIFQSGGPTGRSFPNASEPIIVKQYEQFLERVGCQDDGVAEDLLACLRQVDVDLIEQTSTALLADYRYNGTHPFQAVSGAAIIPRLPSETWESGEWNHVPALTSFITDEGSMYAPTNLTTDEQAWSWLSNLYPGLDSSDREAFSRLYPDPQADSSSPYVDARGQSAQFTRLTAVYGDTSYISASQEIASRLSAADIPVWKLHWNTNNSITPYLGISHGSDVPYAWAEPDTQYPEAGKILAGYYASFVVHGDPNTLKASPAAEWSLYSKPGSDGLGWQVNVSPNGTWLEEDSIRREALEYWRSIAVKLNH